MKTIRLLTYLLATMLSSMGPFLYSSQSVASVLEILEEITIKTEDGVFLRGVRLHNPDRPPVVLVHGFGENTYIFKEKALALYDQGFDVYMFNLRGHGNGEHKSVHPRIDPTSSKGLYSFDNIVTEDIPAIIDYVYQGKPIMMIGHSLGGVAIRLFLSGYRKGQNGVYLSRNQAKIKLYLNKVHVAVANASPTTFKKDFRKYNYWTHLPNAVTQFLLQNMIHDETPVREQRGFFSKIYKDFNERFHDSLHRFLLRFVYEGIVNMDNFDFSTKEAGKKFLRGFSSVPLDLMQDAKRWKGESESDKGFSSRSGVRFEGAKIPDELSFFMIGGDLDELASVQEMIQDVKTNAIYSRNKIIILKGFSHVDLAAGKKSASILAPIYKSIYEDPNGEKVHQEKSAGVLIKEPKIVAKLWCQSLFSR